MNPRERYIATLTFGKPDKIPFEPGGPRESTLKAWHQQGLPENEPWYPYLLRTLGIMPETTQPHIDPGIDFRMIPQFEERVLDHRNGHFIVQDWMGAIVEISDEYDLTYLRQAKDFVTRHWHSFPVKTRTDWVEKIKWRYNPDDPLRFPSDFAERCKKLNQRDYPLRLSLSGPFWQLREWCGFEHLCMLMIEEPQFVQEMVDFWSDFISATLEKVVEHLEIDSLMVNEDMAYKMHSMISPAMTRHFLVPVWKRWSGVLKDKCAVYSVDSDGYIGELIPCFIEGGFKYTWPIEVAAGNDIVAFRKKYGKKIAFGGGIDKRALAVGGETMRNELLRVIPPLLEDGGYLPGCDHGVPPDISWDNFVDYSRFLAQLIGWL